MVRYTIRYNTGARWHSRTTDQVSFAAFFPIWISLAGMTHDGSTQPNALSDHHHVGVEGDARFDKVRGLHCLSAEPVAILMRCTPTAQWRLYFSSAHRHDHASNVRSDVRVQYSDLVQQRIQFPILSIAHLSSMRNTKDRLGILPNLLTHRFRRFAPQSRDAFNYIAHVGRFVAFTAMWVRG